MSKRVTVRKWFVSLATRGPVKSSVKQLRGPEKSGRGPVFEDPRRLNLIFRPFFVVLPHAPSPNVFDLAGEIRVPGDPECKATSSRVAGISKRCFDRDEGGCLVV